MKSVAAFAAVIGCVHGTGVADATFPGRPGRLVFSAHTHRNFVLRGNNFVIWAYNPRTGERRRLTMRPSYCTADDGSWEDTTPTLSPDGRMIAYRHWDSCGLGDRSQIRVMRADGSRNRVLAQGDFLSQYLAFAPNGSRLDTFGAL